MKSVIIAFFLSLLVFFQFSCSEKKEYQNIPKEDSLFASTKPIHDSLFVGDKACKECHKNEFKDWQGSHHDKAMQIADENTVLAPFKGEEFTNQGIVSKFYIKNNTFYVNTEGPDGKYHDYKVIYTFGVTPLQQYIVQFPNGHFQCLRTAWDTKKNEWFDLYPDFKVVHSEWLHWSRGALNWNNMCADCHSTNVRKNYDANNHSYNTKFALINVNCEACHGPGKNHIKNAKTLGDAYQSHGELKMTAATDSKTLVDQCARCHMRREQISERYNFEGTLLDHYFPNLIANETYHPDGQILDEVYVYGSFVQSKMYHNDVTCTDCHDAHSLKLKFNDNQLCLQCHVPEKYDTSKHHFHKKNTDGAQCINCHMTGRFYMGNDYRRDHSFRIPRPDLSIKYNTPNACIQCHEDKDNEWAWENFKKQYGVPDYQHFSELLAPGLTGQENGKESLLTLIKDTLQPEIARASAMRAMRDYMNINDVNNLLQYLNDLSPLVRATTIDLLGEINNTEYASYLLPLLKDEKRSVRINAFYGISRLKEEQIPDNYKKVYQKVKKEFNTSLDVISDFAGGNAKRASYLLRQGNIQESIKYYEKALEIDNINNLIRTNLANLYYSNDEHLKAEESFKTIIKQEPEYGPTYYSLGLLYAELNQPEKAIIQFEKTILYMPQNVRAYYNLCLLHDKQNDFASAKTTVLKGITIAPNNVDLLYTAAYLFSKNGDNQKAVFYAKELLRIEPNNQQYINLLQQVGATN